MGRASQADSLRHRDEVVTATSRMLRERGAAGVSVQDVMSAAGLTHGGFYKHFSSKDELVGIAATAAFGELVDAMSLLREEYPDGAQAAPRLLADYLSPEHRDDPGSGCANTGLAADSARAGRDGVLRESYTVGLKQTLEGLAGLIAAAGHDEGESRRRAIEHLSTMVGALTLARATAGDAVSGEILDVVRTELEGRW